MKRLRKQKRFSPDYNFRFGMMSVRALDWWQSGVAFSYSTSTDDKFYELCITVNYNLLMRLKRKFSKYLVKK